MKNKKRKLLIVQPILADYRVVFFNKLSRMYNVLLCCDKTDDKSGHGIFGDVSFDISFCKILLANFCGLYYQVGLVKNFFSFKPDVIFITAHPKNISFWFLLLIAKIFKKEVLAHGQGFYNKPNPSLIIILAYKILLRLCSRYVCYTESTKLSLQSLGSRYSNKLVVVDNTIFNPFSLTSRVIDSESNGVLFVGRLRNGSNFRDLADAIIYLNSRAGNSENYIYLHVIGSGERYQEYYNKYRVYEYIVFYGAVYDQQEVTNISRKCFVGCYPGFAGLSVVHHFSLSLPTIVNSDLTSHMGPEPSYIKNGFNGFLFDEYSSTCIRRVISHVASIKDSPEYSAMCINAHQSYRDLINPDFSDKLKDIIEDLF